MKGNLRAKGVEEGAGPLRAGKWFVPTLACLCHWLNSTVSVPYGLGLLESHDQAARI